MRVIFLTDIHGMTDNFNKISNIIDSFDLIVLLGDIFSCNHQRVKGVYDPNYLRDFFNIRKDKVKYVIGNVDTIEDINSLEYSALPFMIINLDGLKVGLIHNIDSVDKYPNLDVIVCGHTHISNIDEIDNMIYLNPGSLSIPKDGIPSYLTYDNNLFTIYDINGVIIDQKKVCN